MKLLCYFLNYVFFLFSCEFVFELGNERTHRLLWVLKFDFLIYFNSRLCGSCKLMLKKKNYIQQATLFSPLWNLLTFFSVEFIDFFPHLTKFKLNLYMENKILFYFLYHLKNIFFKELFLEAKCGCYHIDHKY